jgi:hypothetical protein
MALWEHVQAVSALSSNPFSEHLHAAILQNCWNHQNQRLVPSNAITRVISDAGSDVTTPPIDAAMNSPFPIDGTSVKGTQQDLTFLYVPAIKMS